MGKRTKRFKAISFIKVIIMIIGILTLLFVYVTAVPEVNHLIEIDHMGRKVAMDVIHDTEEKTVIAIVGDVCKYKNGVPTVNFHDYSTGYDGDVDKQRNGWTTEVHDHILNIVQREMTYEEVKALAGHKVAAFCKDYRSMHATVSPFKKLRRDAAFTSSSSLSYMWCVFSSCAAKSTDAL
ncbi:unnamed protein product [Mytilus coruscus]|uniref:Uncharacterized protein n=1 Tax=Mytilus coruscus TaxID=42192 RepID=A0A6J8BRA0_MYTCO|nr:unnamed protein product [Mytilus coruscus]